MANEWQPIDNGQVQASARFYNISIPAGGVYTLNSPFNVCKCLKANQAFKVAWTSSAGETDFAEGWKVRFPVVIPYVQIFNHSANVLIVTLGVGIGDVDDSSFVVSGTVYTQPAPYSTFSATEYTFDSTGKITLPAASRLIIQNTGNSPVFVGAANGLKVLTNGSITLDVSSAVDVFGTDTETISVGSFV